MTCLKLPSIPETSMAFVIMRVNRKGTFSGNFSRFMLACKVPAKFVKDFCYEVSLCHRHALHCLITTKKKI